ncbi:hypothetical protein [Shimia abyssi]|uniref:Uncharacterized protein n=1 Tax=Shimia abyssi TaxID=1662395 RepID=A0A2P8F7X0_9RHOB|nr:hypothetical protein [Shimia abyssi]PSL17819.1 hypothetical protein CLV88_11431 [Shimia abyssi]
MKAWVLTAAILATPVAAQEWTTREGDTVFDAEALSARLSGQTLVFYDDGRSVYEADGKYNYTYGGGGTWFGHWETKGDSVVCVTFVTGVERCDRIVENAGKLIVLTADGQRFPVRPQEG